MNIIKTKTFELAIYEKGDSNSPKFAIVVPGRLDTKDYVHNTSLVDYLASRGYFALSFDLTRPASGRVLGVLSSTQLQTCLKLLMS